MLDRLATLAHGLWVCIKALLHSFEQMLMLLSRNPPVCTENLNPNVLTMKSAQYGARIYDAGSLNLASESHVFAKSFCSASLRNLT
jgi:hypothetical protein